MEPPRRRDAESRPIQIYLARHAESEWQAQPSDDLDTSLTAIGREQATCMGQWFACRPRLDRDARVEIAGLVTSRLRRAQETAAVLAHVLGLPVAVDPCLDEASFVVSRHLPALDGPLDLTPAFAPSVQYAEFKRQAHEALGRLAERARNAGGPILAITHSGLIKTLLRVVCGGDAVSFTVYNTGIALIEFTRGRWHLVHVNLWDHLRPHLRTR
jgi:broad specificity phosphatase PhoE